MQIAFPAFIFRIIRTAFSQRSSLLVSCRSAPFRFGACQPAKPRSTVSRNCWVVLSRISVPYTMAEIDRFLVIVEDDDRGTLAAHGIKRGEKQTRQDHIQFQLCGNFATDLIQQFNCRSLIASACFLFVKSRTASSFFMDRLFGAVHKYFKPVPVFNSTIRSSGESQLASRNCLNAARAAWPSGAARIPSSSAISFWQSTISSSVTATAVPRIL